MSLRILLFLFYVTISCTGLYKMKMSRAFPDIDFLMGTVFYGIGFILWLLILKLHPLSFAFPIAAGSLIIGTQLVGIILLNEPLGLTHVIGILLILAGIFLVFHGQPQT